jgi:hypothetical protein
MYEWERIRTLDRVSQNGSSLLSSFRDDPASGIAGRYCTVISELGMTSTEIVHTSSNEENGRGGDWISDWLVEEEVHALMRQEQD